MNCVKEDIVKGVNVQMTAEREKLRINTRSTDLTWSQRFLKTITDSTIKGITWRFTTLSHKYILLALS